jgi:predicted CoA-substrate-specific enzyme activase
VAAQAYLGIDIGSLTVKVVALDEQAHILGRGLAEAGYGGQEAAEFLVNKVLQESSVLPGAVACTVVTGYGRVRFAAADREVSEISCHARGAMHLNQATRTVIDIGGQDSKAIRLDESGRVVDFAMNDKCAAGTGRFLEVMAGALGVSVGQLGALALTSSTPVTISSTCTVFAESEAVSHISRGATRQDVARGLLQAICSRVLGLTARVGMLPAVVLTGGVALNEGIVAELSRQSATVVWVPPDPQTVGALGAALYALQYGKTK